jgi:hypothetical protein
MTDYSNELTIENSAVVLIDHRSRPAVLVHQPSCNASRSRAERIGLSR